MKSGIYKILNIVTEKCYIGSAVNIEGVRWPRHKRDLNKGEHHSIYLQRAWDKYRENSFLFEIIEECEPVKEVLETREQYYIDVLKPEYNMCLIAGSRLGMKQSEETKKKLSESHRGENCYMFGKHLSEQTKQKLSEAHKGKRFSEQTKERMSEAFRGENHSNAILNWDIVHEIRRRYKEENISQYKLAFDYGVSRGCIQGIVENRNWKEDA